MKRIVIEIPDDCPVQDALYYMVGCFNPVQHDYMSIKPGYRNGHFLPFGDGRWGYFYKDLHDGYCLKLKARNEK